MLLRMALAWSVTLPVTLSTSTRLAVLSTDLTDTLVFASRM